MYDIPTALEKNTDTAMTQDQTIRNVVMQLWRVPGVTQVGVAVH